MDILAQKTMLQSWLEGIYANKIDMGVLYITYSLASYISSDDVLLIDIHNMNLLSPKWLYLAIQ